MAIDAVLPAGDGWRLFRLGALLQARVPASPDAWSHGKARGPVEWLKLAAPAGPFRPVHAVAGLRGYFHLVDAASGRLCLYDAEAGLISTFPLPEEFTPFPAGRAAVFRGADGAFTFLDYASGEAWQFAERQTVDAGATQWIPRGKVKLPAGARDCIQVPGSTELLCRGGDGSALRFDGALNRISPRAEIPAPSGSGLRAVWGVAGGAAPSGWTMEGVAGEATLFRFHPAQRRLLPPPTP